MNPAISFMFLTQVSPLPSSFLRENSVGVASSTTRPPRTSALSWAPFSLISSITVALSSLLHSFSDAIQAFDIKSSDPLKGARLFATYPEPHLSVLGAVTDQVRGVSRGEKEEDRGHSGARSVCVGHLGPSTGTAEDGAAGSPRSHARPHQHGLRPQLWMCHQSCKGLRPATLLPPRRLWLARLQVRSLKEGERVQLQQLEVVLGARSLSHARRRSRGMDVFLLHWFPSTRSQSSLFTRATSRQTSAHF